MRKFRQRSNLIKTQLKTNTILLILTLFFTFSRALGQTSMPYSQDFENPTHGWTLSNGTEANQWHVGSAVSNGGTQSLYVSDDNGLTDNYSIGTSSVVHASKDFLLTSPEIVLEFDWQALGESCCDYLRVWLVPSNFTPAAGTQITASTDRINLFGNLNMNASFKREQLIQDVSNYTAAGSFQVIFEWRNDGSVGSMPSAAIDNIYINSITCYQPIDATITQASPSSVNIIVTPNPNNSTNVTYEYELRTSGTQGSGSTGLVSSGTSNTSAFSVTGLQPKTIYTIFIRTSCSSADKSIYSSYTFVNAPTTLPYTQDFEGANSEWIISNDSSPNKWIIGNSISNGGSQSLYISSDNGVSNNYDTSSSSTVHAYKDFATPTNIAEITIGFDWHAVGESCCDYLRVWLVPSTFTPLVGTQITASADRIDLFGNLNMNSSFKREQLIQDITNHPGSFRIIFEWRNDGSVGTMPSAAIDNIEILPLTCNRPTAITLSEITKNSTTVTVTPHPLSSASVSYEYEIRTSGNPGSGTVGLVTTGVSNSDTFIISGLQPSHEYILYIRTVCTSSDRSIWTIGSEFETMCDYSDFISYTSELELCGPQKAKLNATLVDSTTEAAWYDKENDSTPLYEGLNFISDSDITQDRSFWLRSRKVTTNTPVPVGDGVIADGGTWNFLYNGWEGIKTEYIYTVAELNAAGLTAGPINAIKFDIENEGNYNPRLNFKIAIGNTTQTTTQTTFIPYTSLTEVYDNPAQPLSIGVNQFIFTTPFNWDGISNIVVQVANDNGDWGGTNGSIKGHITLDNQTTYYYTDGAGIQGILAATTGTATTTRANVIFVGVAGCISPAIEIPVTVVPKPAFELSTDKIISCEGDATEAVKITTNLGGYDTFVWTPSTGVSGDEVNGWTFNTNQEQEYTLVASQSNGICEHVKTVLVTSGIKPEPNPNLATVHDVCKNTVTELNVLEDVLSTITIGNLATTTAPTSEVSAFVQSAEFSKQQYIYSAAELLAQGLTTAGYITELAFETINSGASLTNDNYTIKMMLTANTTFPDNNFVTGNFHTVYSAAMHTHTFQGIQNMVLNTPFYWDGQSNIIVQITQEGIGSGNNAETYFTSVAGNNVGLHGSSATDPDPVSGTRTTDRLDLRFGLEQSKVTWSPAANLYLDAATTIPYTSGANALTVYTIQSLGGTQVYTALLTAPSGCSTSVDYTINVADVGTPIVQGQTFCEATPVTDVVVTGHQGATLVFYDDATTTTPITTISQTGTYYVEAVLGSCKSACIPFTATITPLGLPTASFTQVICGAGTIADLTATGISGSQINWYDSATSTTVLPSTHPLVDNTTYYAAQQLGNCESGRIAVLVSINTTALPALTAQTITVCGDLTYGSIDLNQINGSELVWYPSATSQTPIPNTDAIVSGTYYVSQKLNNCESVRVPITVSSAQSTVPAPTAGVQNICGSGTVAQLSANILPNAIALWYSDATSTTPLQLTDVLVNGTYYLAQQEDNCISPKIPVAVRVTNTAAPAVAPFILCEGSIIADLNISDPTGISHKWFINSSSTIELPLTDILISGYYFVVRVENGCESARTQVQVTINSRPESPTGASPQTFTDYAEISNLIMDEPNVIWYITYDDAINGINPLSQDMPLVDGTTYYAVIVGANGCPSLPTPIKTIIVLGVNDFDLSKLKYYPNPVNDLLTITYADVITNVEVFDLNGRMVIKRDFDNQTVQLDFSSLSSGTYMLNIKTQENSQFVKIVKK